MLPKDAYGFQSARMGNYHHIAHEGIAFSAYHCAVQNRENLGSLITDNIYAGVRAPHVESL